MQALTLYRRLNQNECALLQALEHLRVFSGEWIPQTCRATDWERQVPPRKNFKDSTFTKRGRILGIVCEVSWSKS